MPTTSSRSLRRLRALAVFQAAVIVMALGVPAAALASLSAVVPGTQSPNPVAPGGTATYNVQVTNGSGSARVVSITSISGLPTGAALASSACVVVPDDGASHTVAVTVSTTGATPAGTSAITMTATRWNNTAAPCSGGVSDTRTGTGSLVVAVAKVDTTTTITADTPDPSNVGSAYAVDVSVTRASGSAAITGNVVISDGTDSCTDTTATGGGAATVTYSCNLTSTTTGAKTLTATYAGNAALNGSAGTTAHTVNGIATTTTITSDTPDPSYVGAAYAVNVSVTRASGSATITGTVTVSDGTDSCTDTTATGGGAATVTYSCNLTSTTPGLKTLTATYPGNATLSGSAGTAGHTVNSVDGNGTMAITYAEVGSTTPSAIPITPGKSLELIDFTFTAGAGGLAAGSQITLVIPAGWSPPTKTAGTDGAVSVTSSNCSEPDTGTSDFTISGSGPWTIVFTAPNCAAGNQFNLRYGNAAGVYVVAPNAKGDYEFTTSTAGPGGTLTGIASQPELTVVGSAQAALSITGPATKTYGDAPFAPTTSGGSGSGAVTYASTTPSVCTASDSASVTIVGAGTCTVTATKAGDSTYNATTSAPYSITVDKAPLTVTVIDTTKTYGDANPAFTPQVTGLVNGDTSLDLGGAPVVTTTADASSPVGNYPVSISGFTSPDYDITFVDGNLEITKADPVCTITGFDGTYDGSAHGASGQCLGVNDEILAGLVLGSSYTNVPGGTASWAFTDVTGNYTDDAGSVDIVIARADPVCAISGFDGVYDASAHGATGTCRGVNDEILAGLVLGSSYTNVPGGTASWAFTDVTGNYTDDAGSVDIVIARADPVCAISGFDGVYDASAHGATGTCRGVDDEVLAGLVLGSSYTNVPGGTASWAFTDVTGNYTDDAGSVDIVIARADPVCTINGFDGPFDASAHGATGTCRGVENEVLPGLDLGASFTSVPGGTADWVFTDSTGNYTDDAGSVDIAIGRTPQVIDFPELPNVNEGAESFELAATTDSGLPITYASLTPDVCTVEGTTVTIVGVGTCTIEASQPGDENFAPAGSVLQSFEVRAADSTTPDTNTSPLAAIAGDSGPIPPALFLGLLAVGVLGTLLVLLGIRARREGLVAEDRER